MSELLGHTRLNAINETPTNYPWSILQHLISTVEMSKYLFTITAQILTAHWLTFIANKRTDT